MSERVFYYDKLTDKEKKDCKKVEKLAIEGVPKEKLPLHIAGINLKDHPSFHVVKMKKPGRSKEIIEKRYYDEGFAQYDLFVLRALNDLIEQKNVNAVTKAASTRFVETYNQKIAEIKELNKQNQEIERIMVIDDINNPPQFQIPKKVESEEEDLDAEEESEE